MFVDLAALAARKPADREKYLKDEVAGNGEQAVAGDVAEGNIACARRFVGLPSPDHVRALPDLLAIAALRTSARNASSGRPSAAATP